MIRDCEMLNTIRNTVQMGQIGIESVIPEAEDARFCAVLRQQLAEYHEIRQEADGLLKQLGGKRKDPSGMAACCARMGETASSTHWVRRPGMPGQMPWRLPRQTK